MSRLNFPTHAPALTEVQRATLWAKETKFPSGSSARAVVRGYVEVQGVPSYVTQVAGEFGQIQAK